MSIHWVFWGICLGIALPTCAAVGQDSQRVTLVLQWQHQAQFAGYYMAQEKGFYRRAGLDVSILRGGPDVRVVELLLSGTADFGTLMLPTALGERARGVPLVHLGQFVNRSNLQLVAWHRPADGGLIDELADLDGRQVTLWGHDFRAPYMALFHLHGVNPVILPQYTTFSLFLHRGADAFAAMRYNEYHSLLQSGVLAEEVRVFTLRDYGIQVPEDGLYVLEQTWQGYPETCRALMQASLEGWRYARNHPEETLDVVMRYIDESQLPTNRVHMRWMLGEMIASVFPGPDDRWIAGELSRGDFDAAVQLLMRHGGLHQALKYESVVAGSVADD